MLRPVQSQKTSACKLLILGCGKWFENPHYALKIVFFETNDLIGQSNYIWKVGVSMHPEYQGFGLKKSLIHSR